MAPLVVPARSPRRWRKILLLAGIVLAGLFAACRIAVHYLVENVMLTTGPNGPDTPATLGVPFERIAIPSGPRRLDSYVVTAASTCANPPAVLIFHGIQETISDWVKAQRFLYSHCISSVVFDYPGSGNSSRPASFDALAEDSLAAYAFTSGHFPGRPLYVLGHSMGNAPMLEAVPHFSSPPAGVIVASAFASLRSAAGTTNNLFYRMLAHTIPDWWNNVKAVQQIHVPLLVIHSDADHVNPVAAARKIFAAAPQPKKLVLLHGYNHNALYQQPSDDWWSAVLAFVSTNSPARSPVPGGDAALAPQVLAGPLFRQPRRGAVRLLRSCLSPVSHVTGEALPRVLVWESTLFNWQITVSSFDQVSKGEGAIVTSPTGSSLSELCVRVRQLGYAASKRIRIYGEDFEVVSDPFPHDQGIALQVKTKTDVKTRILRLPVTLYQAPRAPRRVA